ncbi:MAG: ATP-dependent DNA helicase PcrA [Ruminococcaceae bacterium]|nr:ATP-dependent DNA helicase PcrA [Oscillospiraceae bacterium]
MTENFESRFMAARRAYIAAQFSNLNNMQQEAVLTTEGPLLLLAGAGSGKTTVLIHRIANILRFGSGSDSTYVPEDMTEEDLQFLENLPDPMTDHDCRRAEFLCGVEVPNPWNIIAITFTNKAAGELKERLEHMLGDMGRDIWAMTFHSACCRILRRDIERLGYDKHFTIYDTADSERLMREICKDMNLDDKVFPYRSILNVISKEKDKMVSPEQLLDFAYDRNDIRMVTMAKAYRRYQEKLKENNAVDFDDIILLTVKLLQQHEDLRTFYQRKFRYVLVDEYQDTNHLQYLLTSLLAGGYENICVVGDDDQSIYRFRGATIANILDFEKQYRGARVIRLEQNYRSTQSILNAANAVIAHNVGRKGKRLWTANGGGDPIVVYEAADESGEANYIAGQIIRGTRGKNFRDYAILYRTNAQSNAIEYAFKRNGIPYRIIGGTRFFDRAEVKDMLAYLCVINNRADDLRLSRIINNPPRGLGEKSLLEAYRLAAAEQKPVYEVISHPDEYGPLQKNAEKFRRFTNIIESLDQMLAAGMALPDFYEELLIRSGYVDMLQKKDTEENKTRLENVRELKSSILAYMENTDEPTLAGFLEEIALYTDIEQYDASDDAVVMMTMHASKGLEFPHVFLVGFEDGLFPGMRCIGDHEEMEEERRLCYVAITRAKKTLTITYARQRMLYGRTNAAMVSRFVKELPQNDILRKSTSEPRRTSTWEIPSYRPQTSPSELSRRAAPDPQTPKLDLRKGDMVEHTAFGRGMVLSVLPMGGDALLEIAFDRLGTKKLMAKTASAHMKKV